MRVTALNYHAGLEISLKEGNARVVDTKGKVVRARPGTDCGALHAGDGNRCDAGCGARLWSELAKLHYQILKIARTDRICHLSMILPASA